MQNRVVLLLCCLAATAITVALAAEKDVSSLQIGVKVRMVQASIRGKWERVKLDP